MTQTKILRNRIYIGAGALVASLILLFSNVLANASPVKAASAIPPASGSTVMLNRTGSQILAHICPFRRFRRRGRRTSRSPAGVVCR